MRVQTKSGKLKLVHHKHTGRRLEHKHTSYHGLAIVLGVAAIVIVMLGVMGGKAQADSDFGVTASVYAPPPGQAAQISQPDEGAVFTSNPVTVAGTCEVADPAHVVRIYSNNQLIGSTTCNGSGTFSVQVDLFSGDNTLVPHIYTFQGVEGPVGNPVHVRLNLPTNPPPSGGSQSSSNPGSSSPTTTPTTSSDFRLRPSEANLFFVPDKPLDVVFAISGGSAPYSLTIDWGDGDVDSLAIVAAQEVKLIHTFHGAGPYTIQIEATDANDDTAHLELVAVSGTPTGGSTSSGSGGVSSEDKGPLATLRRLRHELFSGSNGVVMISYFAVSVLTIGFWAGDHWLILFAARRRHKHQA